ncbi:MAG TPA: AEC family transporter, partial [Promineifilum sp.]|nr:AEC family transporter [Promineifilum sp.]
RRRFSLHVGTLSTVVFQVLSPCLVFSSLATSKLPGGELAELVAFSALNIVVMGGLAFGLARLLRLDRVGSATLMIVTMFVNGGNYGLTLLQLRNGDDGLSRGIVYYVTSTVMVYTLGVMIASMGRTDWRGTLGRMLRLPAVYPALLAIVVYSLNIPIPAPIMSGIAIAGNGAIPVMLLVLGMQIADMRPEDSTNFVWPAVGLRLVGGPFVGLAVATVLGLQGLSRSSMIVESAMPTAVINLILASEFSLPTSVVARIVVFSTLVSPLTVAATITLLGL